MKKGFRGMQAALWLQSLVLMICIGINMLFFPVQGFAAEVGSEKIEIFESVQITDFGGTVTIRSGEEYAVSYEGEEKFRPETSFEDGMLVIAGVTEQTSDEESGASLCSLVITIPAGTRLETVTAGRVGTIILTDLTVGTADLKNITGDIFCKNVSLKKGEMQTGDGNIQISEGAFNNLNLDSSTGDIYVSEAAGLSRCQVTAYTEKGTVTAGGSVKGKTFRQNGNGKRYLTINTKEGDAFLLY